MIAQRLNAISGARRHRPPSNFRAGWSSTSLVPNLSRLRLGFALLVQFTDWQGTDWHREFPPFKIAGNLYYVGTADLAVYLIATPQGNILINSDFPEDVPLMRKSIERIGFKNRTPEFY